MTPERWQEINELFQSASERPTDERRAFLDAACGGDTELRQEVESLLACEDAAASFFENPVPEAAFAGLGEDQEAVLPGRRIGPYQVLREIGRGGMGAVYLAERADQHFRKQVAIKLVKRGMDTDAILRRFHQEEQILADLDHPNIARLLDGGTTEDGLSYFIMEFVAGQPIDVYCDAHYLSIEARLALFRTVCSAVQYAHEQHVVHRDLKPSNILVTADGVVKLLDFGIAKVLDPERALQTTDSPTAGRPMTPEYASPEQVRGEAITPQSDVYALGVLLYELLTGHRPYRVPTRTPETIARVICEEEPEKPSTAVSRVEEVPSPDGAESLQISPASVSAARADSPERLRRRLMGDLDNIVLMALRKEPERRYASVEEFSEDVRRHLEGVPVLARKDILWYRSAKFIKRNKAGVIAATLSAVIVLALVVGFYLLAQRERIPGKAIDSIAILPLVNASADLEAEYLSDGITESIISRLSQVPKLRVMARSTVFRYKGADPKKAGRDLNVRAVLIGRILQRGDTLSIRTELVNVADGSQLWGAQYHRKITDILAVQEEIAREISEKLRLKLTDEEQKRLSKRYTENAEAYQLYLRGQYHLDKRTVKEIEKSIDYFQQAIRIDPRYALAYARLAAAYSSLHVWGAAPPQEMIPKAKTAIAQALAMDDQLAEAYAMLGNIKTIYDWDWSGAEKAHQRSLELDPNSEFVHRAYAHSLRATGRLDEALVQINQALALDPLSVVNNRNLGMILYFARQYDQAIEQCQKTLELDPNFATVYGWLERAYEAKGLYDQAIAADLQWVTLSGDSPEVVTALREAYRVSGWKGYWRKQLEWTKERAQRSRYFDPYQLVMIYARLGEKDQALAWLEKSYQDRNFVVFIKIDPLLDNLRTDSRFSDLLQHLKLPP